MLPYALFFQSAEYATEAPTDSAVGDVFCNLAKMASFWRVSDVHKDPRADEVLLLLSVAKRDRVLELWQPFRGLLFHLAITVQAASRTSRNCLGDSAHSIRVHGVCRGERRHHRAFAPYLAEANLANLAHVDDIQQL